MNQPLKPQLRIEDLTVAVSLGLILAIGYFISIPQASRLAEKKQELNSKQAEVANLEARVNQLSQIATKLTEYKDEIARLQTAYPKEDQTVEALIQSKQMIERAGMAIGSLGPGAAKGGSLPVNFTVNGSYESMVRLLNELYVNLRPVVVKSVNIAAGQAKDAGTLSISLTTDFEFAGNPAAGQLPAGAAPAAAVPAATADSPASP